MTTDIEALITDLRRDAHEPGVAPATALQAADALESVAAERDDLETRLAELLCELTDGRMSKTGYDVKTMVDEVEATFDQAVQEDISNAWNEAVHAREERDALRAIIDEALDSLRENEDPDTVVIDILSRATTTEKGTEA